MEEDEGFDLHFCLWGKNAGSHQCLHWWQRLSTGHFFTLLRKAALFESPFKAKKHPTTMWLGVFCIRTLILKCCDPQGSFFA